MRKFSCTLLMIISMFASAMTARPSLPQAEQAATFDERLGDDDGAALAMLISANERGNLEVCD
ncbi:MAG TPA: hypothetical protein VF747_15160 [Blastocatellia bacterium]